MRMNERPMRRLGISRRAYGDDTTAFLRALKATRPQEIDALAKYKLTPVTLRAAD